MPMMAKTSFAGLAVAMALAAPAAAMETGAYEGIADGGRLSVTVKNDRVSVGVGSAGCGGAGNGRIRKIAKDRWQITLRDSGNSCRIDVARQGENRYNLAEDGCSFFHGFACSFDGFVTRR